jgi:hypothetical protein
VSERDSWSPSPSLSNNTSLNLQENHLISDRSEKLLHFPAITISSCSILAPHPYLSLGVDLQLRLPSSGPWVDPGSLTPLNIFAHMIDQDTPDRYSRRQTPHYTATSTFDVSNRLSAFIYNFVHTSAPFFPSAIADELFQLRQHPVHCSKQSTWYWNHKRHSPGILVTAGRM